MMIPISFYRCIEPCTRLSSIHASLLESLSNGITEPLEPLNHLLTPVGLLIRPPEADRERADDEDDEGVGSHGGVHAWAVERCVLASEDERACDAADAAEADQGGGAECPLPLSTDIVCLAGGLSVAVGPNDAGQRRLPGTSMPWGCLHLPHPR